MTLSRALTLAVVSQALLGTALAAAQTSPPTKTTATTSTTTSSTSGAFDRLSPGNQKVARALYEAQTTPGTTSPMATKPFTLDEIAAKRNSGEGWGRVFQDMRSRGLVEDRNLGQAVSRYYRHRASAGGEVTTAAGRTVPSDGAGSRSSSTGMKHEHESGVAGGPDSHGGGIDAGTANHGGGNGHAGASAGRGK